jgi:phosphoribosyl 1,2-cyclic phosphodiesterase
LIFLGTGGGRIHSATQYRRTGGIIYSFNGDQAHIDPGPGAIVYLNQMNIDRLKTKWVIVTHNHTDHQNDAPIIIESLHKSLNIPAGILISTDDYIQSLDSYYKALLLDIIPMKHKKEIILTPNTRIHGTKVIHGKMDGFGLIFHQTDANNPSKCYKIGFTSDTEIYRDFGKNYTDLDVLIANVLRPGGIVCPRHACVDQILPELKIAKPKVCIITHFGAMFDGPTSNSNLITEQMNYMQEFLGNRTRIIGAQDGMRLKIQELLN